MPTPSRPIRLLIVDDDRELRGPLVGRFERLGMVVSQAASGEEALEHARQTPVDVALLDLHLPGMDGLELLGRLKELQPEVEAVMLTAHSSVETAVRAMKQGAYDYLTKPFAFVELLARVRALLRRGQPAPEKLQVGDLQLDVMRRKVTRDGENIDLAPKEFGILEYMMRNKGRPLSRTMIVEHVWNLDYDGLTNIVDVYIRHLRSKIDDRYLTKLIQTVRGIGYMIEAAEKPASTTPAEIPFERPY